MKLTFQFILLTLALAPIAQINGQSLSASVVLQKTLDQLTSMNSVSYNYIREMRYFADNYHSIDSASMHVEYVKDAVGGFQFQAKKKGSSFIYNGHQTLRLDETNFSIDSSSVTSLKKLESNSFLYHSLVMLRNVLPTIISNDSLVKSVSDTTVNRKRCYSVKIEGEGFYFTGLGAMSHYTDSTLRRPYYLLIDKANYLPVMLIAKLVHGNDDRDFINVTYRSIKRNPAAIAKSNWSYNSYAAKYKPFVPGKVIPVIKVGAAVPMFQLPLYKPSGNDSIGSLQLANKIVLLEFWFKSCGPCMKAMPYYNALQQEYRDKGFQLVTINVEDPKEDIAFFYNKFNPQYPMLYNGNDIFKQLGFTGCPSSVLIDKNGKVVKTFFGYDETKIKESVDAMLAAQ